MNDRPRPYHRAEAERLLDYADEWTAQAGELSPEASELSCLAHAAVHALLAIHDALTAADRYFASEAKQREAAEPDPLDENDHRDRLDASSQRRIVRHGQGHWHTPATSGAWCDADCTEMSLRDWARAFGPLAFAPDADGAPSVTPSVDDDPAGDAVDGEECERRYLNAQTGHERARLTAQLRRVISSVQDSGDLTELDALADEWEAR